MTAGLIRFMSFCGILSLSCVVFIATMFILFCTYHLFKGFLEFLANVTVYDEMIAVDVIDDDEDDVFEEVELDT